jgi:hypothetical protein
LHAGDAVAGVGARLRAGVDAVLIVDVQLILDYAPCGEDFSRR